jgi:hypothetical protein
MKIHHQKIILWNQKWHKKIIWKSEEIKWKIVNFINYIKIYNYYLFQKYNSNSKLEYIIILIILTLVITRNTYRFRWNLFLIIFSIILYCLTLFLIYYKSISIIKLFQECIIILFNHWHLFTTTFKHHFLLNILLF